MQVSAGEISTGEISAMQVSNGEISAEQISAGEISAGEISAEQISTGQISAMQVSAGDNLEPDPVSSDDHFSSLPVVAVGPIVNHATTKRKPKSCELTHITNCAVSLDLEAAGVYHAHAHTRTRIGTDTRKN